MQEFNNCACAIIFALVAMISQCHAEINRVEIAQEFLKALERGDLTSAKKIMGETFIFEDPTFGVAAVDRRSALDIYANYTSGMKSIDKHLLSAYESAGVVVLNYIYHVELEATPAGPLEVHKRIMTEGTRIFAFEDEKIIRHIDLADYSELTALAEN